MKPSKKDVRQPPKFRPVAVVDVGSNSVRLVVYDGLRRAASPVFNEKVLCGLGKGVSLTGKLSEHGIDRALAALRRFRAICRQIDVDDIFAVATAAAREASNGKWFVSKAETALGKRIDVLSGKQEARFAALGVIASIRDADGVVGDLGGGSLELIDVQSGKIRSGTTLPLGPLRLIDLSGGDVAKAAEIVETALAKTSLLDRLRSRNFYAVGGTWRNLSKLHMAQNNYPLRMIHDYRIDTGAAQSVSNLVSGLSPMTLKDIEEISRNRVETLPFGALVLERVLARGKPDQFISSVFGVREGLLYSKLSKRKRDTDPLLAACWDFARSYARSPEHELELCDWSDQFFALWQPRESEQERRLRHAACMVADIDWRVHPEYRGTRALTMISQATFVGIDHPGRAFIALTVYYRGLNSTSEPAALHRLLDELALDRARVLAGVFRLAYVLSAAMPGQLPQIKFSMPGRKKLCVRLPKKLADLGGETVNKRIEQLADLIGCSADVKVG